MLENRLITNELSTGADLNHMVQSNRRADFALVLAMFSPDARDQAQFQLRQEQSLVTVDQEQKLINELQISPLQTPLAGSEADIKKNQQINDLLIRSGAASAKLAHYLNPEAINGKDDLLSIPDEIKENCSLYSQQKLAMAHSDEITVDKSIKHTDETQLFEWLENFDQNKDVKLVSYRAA